MKNIIMESLIENIANLKTTNALNHIKINFIGLGCILLCSTRVRRNNSQHKILQLAT